MSTSRTQNRRRRVVFDEAIQKAARSAPAAGESASSKRPLRKRKYSSQARQSRRLADFIPKRWLTMALVALGGLVGLLLLNLLHWTVSLPLFAENRHWQEAFSFDSPRGLWTWFLVICWSWIAIYSCLIYGLRRHRRDDYRGTYRMWLVLIGFSLLCSLQACMELDRAVLGVVHHFVPREWLRPDSTWIGWLRLGLITLVAGRVFIEMRHSKLSVCFLAVAWLAAGSAVVLRQPEARVWLVDELLILPANVTLLAAIAAVLTSVSYSRFVYMDVFGLRAKFAAERAARRESARRRKAARRRAAEAKAQTKLEAKSSGPPAVAETRVVSTSAKSAEPATTATTTTSDKSRLGPLASRLKFGATPSAASPSSPTSSVTRAAAAPSNTPGHSSVTTADVDDSHARLSKTERKRLKKLQSQNRRAA